MEPPPHARHYKKKLGGNTEEHWGLPGGSADRESACNAGDRGSIPGWEDPLEKGMATQSSILAWRIPWTV